MKENSRMYFLYFCTLSMAILIMIIGFILQFNDSSWQNYWTIIGSLVTVLVAIYGISNEMKTKKVEHKKLMNMKKVQKYEDSLTKVHLESTRTLIRWDEYLKGNANLDIMDLKCEIVETLYNYKALEEAKNLLDQEGDSSDFIENSTLIKSIVGNEKFKDYKNEIKTNFSDLSEIIDLFDKTKMSDNLGKYKYVLGEWIIKKETAAKSKILVGISSRTKEIIAIYNINFENSTKNTVADRVYFQNAELLYESENSSIFGEGPSVPSGYEVASELKEWSSRNPVLYYNRWIHNNRKGLDNELIDIIKKYKKNQDDITGMTDIIVVRTNEYINAVI